MNFDPKEVEECKNDILYEVKGKVAVITINKPKQFGALTLYNYVVLEELLDRAAKEPNTLATLIQGTGKYFSAGADVNKAGSGTPVTRKEKQGVVDYEVRRYYVGPFLGRNTSAAYTFWSHPKLLVCALNGPVIGLSAGLVSCADIIIGKESTFLLVPFANLSLVTEGAAGFTLPHRLGLSLANQALLASQPIASKDLVRSGFLNWTVPDSVSTEDFNKQILSWVTDKTEKLDPYSVEGIKKLIHMPYNAGFGEMVYEEAMGGIERFAKGLPQARFKAMSERTHRHKL